MVVFVPSWLSAYSSDRRTSALLRTMGLKGFNRRLEMEVTLARAVVAFLLFLGVIRPGNAEPTQVKPPKLVGKISLPGVTGRFDHLTVDLATGRLFIAALGNNTVEIVDINKNKYLTRISGVKEPQGIVFDENSNQLFVAEGEGASLDFYDASSLARTKTFRNLPDADNIRLDGQRKRVLVAYGEGAIAAFDIQAAKKLAEGKLDGHPESFKFDESGDTIYVNVPHSSKVVLLNKSTLKVQSSWRPPAAGNYPMALSQQFLFIGCRKPAKLIVFDVRNGQVLQTLALSADCDDLFFDDSAHELYASCGEGFIEVFKQQPNGELKATSKIPTAPGARTSLLVPSMHRYYVAAPKKGLREAEILVFDTLP